MPQWRRLAFILIATAGGVLLVGALLLTLPQLKAPAPTPTLLVPVYFAPTPTITAAPESAGPIAAMVNDNPITLAEWQQAAALDRVMYGLAQQPIASAEATLDRMINARLVLRAAQAQPTSISVTEAQAEARLAILEQTWKVDDTQLATALAAAGITRPQVLAELQRLITIEAFLQQISETQDSTQWLAEQRNQARISIYVDLAATAAQASNILPTATAPVPTPAATPTASTTVPAPQAEIPTGTDEGQLAPDFTLSTTDGKTIRLSDLRGQPVVVNFWATWCPICRSELAALQASYDNYSARGVNMLGVDVREDAITLSSFAAENGLTYPLLLDGDGRVADLYQVRGIPTTLFIDSQGIIRQRHLGPLDEDQFANLVGPLLPSAATPLPAATVTPTTPTGLKRAPAFSLARVDGTQVQLSDYQDKSTVVLVFFRGQT